MSDTLPLLSVIVPIYGVEDYLCTCIESILAQSYLHLEILLIDDGSKGREPEICDYYSQHDQRIKVIHKSNAGLVEARKTGLAHATAQYVTFIDGDDYLASDYYERMMFWIIKEQPDLIAVNFTKVIDGVEQPINQCMESGIYTNEKLQYLFENMNCYQNHFYDFGIWPSTCLKIYKTATLRNLSNAIPNIIRMGEDSAFTFPYILNCNKIIIDNSINGYYYRTTQGSMSTTVDKTLFTGSSTLYNYLKPFYIKTKCDNIVTQLEYYRTLLIKFAIDYWMKDENFFEISKSIIQLQHLVSLSSIFHDMDSIFDLEIPPILRDNLLMIHNKEWRKLKLLWMKRSALSFLHTMANKILRKV